MNADDPVNWLARAFDERRKHLQRQMDEMLGHDAAPEADDYALLMRLLFEDAERNGKADSK